MSNPCASIVNCLTIIRLLVFTVLAATTLVSGQYKNMSVSVTSDLRPLAPPNTSLLQEKLRLHERRDLKNHRKRLIRDLLHPLNYDKRLRPADTYGSPINVTFRMNLYQILDVAEPTQTIQLYIWATQIWRDNFLGWDPDQYGGVTEMVLPYNSIWLPDTYLYNGIEMSKENSENGINVKVTTNISSNPPVGEVRLMYPAIYSFSCSLYIRYFPFDKQKCRMIFSSWTHDSGDIDYNMESEQVLLESYVPNGEWKLLQFKFTRDAVKFSCCEHPWALLYADLVIQRKPLFYLVNLVLPSAIITMVAIVGFFMPASTNGERSEKVNLGITTLLAMAILLLMVSDAMPTTSNFIPLLGWFYLNVILLTSIGTLLTSTVIWVQSQARFGEPVPKFWRNWIMKIARRFYVHPRPQLVQWWLDNGYDHNGVVITNLIGGTSKPMYHDTTKETLLGTTSNISHSAQASPAAHLSPIANRPVAGYSPNNKLTSPEISSPQKQLLRAITKFEAAEFEWQLFSDVLDRILLIIFSVAVVCVTVSILVTGLMLNEEAAIID